MAPHVSVIVSTYNRQTMLDEALASVLAQRDVDLEAVVVDNGSNDGTSAALQRIDDPRLKVIRNEHSLGATGGRNTGLAAAAGEWIGIVDDDDLWAPDKLRMQLDAAQRGGRDWAYAGCVYIDGRRRIVGGSPPPDPETVMAVLPQRYVIPAGISNAVWRRSALDEQGLLDQRLSLTVDWDLSLRLARHGAPAVVSRPLVAYRQHGANLSRRAAQFYDEMEVIETKFADLLGGAKVDRGLQRRFLGSEALRTGARREAAVAYWQGVREGDWGSAIRAAGLLAPRRLQPALRRRFLSDPEWLREAEAWLRNSPTVAGQPLSS